jgi:hypothetical protein
MFMTELKLDNVTNYYKKKDLVSMLYRVNPLTANPRKYRVMSPLIWECNKHNVEIPEGFFTDLVTVPTILGKYFPSTSPITKAAVLHDFIYATGMMSKYDADLLFRKAMGVVGVSLGLRTTAYTAVTLFASIPWYQWKIIRSQPIEWSKQSGLPIEIIKKK